MKLKFELVTTKYYEVSDKPTMEELSDIAIKLQETSIGINEEDEEEDRFVTWYFKVRIPDELIPHFKSMSEFCDTSQYPCKPRPNEVGMIGCFRIFKEIKD